MSCLEPRECYVSDRYIYDFIDKMLSNQQKNKTSTIISCKSNHLFKVNNFPWDRVPTVMKILENVFNLKTGLGQVWTFFGEKNVMTAFGKVMVIILSFYIHLRM